MSQHWYISLLWYISLMALNIKNNGCPIKYNNYA